MLKKKEKSDYLLDNRLLWCTIRDFAAADRVCRPAAPLSVALDRDLLECPPDILPTVTPLRVRVPRILYVYKSSHQTVRAFVLVRHEGLEPPTFTFVVCHSIQLS